MVRDRGFEPLTPSVSRKCSTTELTAQNRFKPELKGTGTADRVIVSWASRKQFWLFQFDRQGFWIIVNHMVN